MLEHIVKIQALFRGHNVRKLLKKKGYFDDKIDNSIFFRNAKVKAAYEREGPF